MTELDVTPGEGWEYYFRGCYYFNSTYGAAFLLRDASLGTYVNINTEFAGWLTFHLCDLQYVALLSSPASEVYELYRAKAEEGGGE